MAIHARRVRFDWRNTPLHWIPGDPQLTHTINVLHLLLPAGERWFVSMYRQALRSLPEGAHELDVRGFMGQEGTHARAHAEVLEHLASQGLDTSPFTRRIDWLFERLLSDAPLGVVLPRWLDRPWLDHRLAIIAAIEHFTTVLGAWMLEAEALVDTGADPTMIDLLRWHAAEEVEHRAVAFDLYRASSGSWLWRTVALCEVAVVLAFLWERGTVFLMSRDPTRPGRPRWGGFRRAGRAGKLPTAGLLLRSIPRYLRPRHHPSTEGSTDRALAYLAVSPSLRAFA